MNFFEHQDRARRKTGLLIFYYVLSIIGIFAAFYALFCFCALLVFADTYGKTLENNYYISLPIFGITILFVLSIVGGGSLVKILLLSSGGGASVAESMGGRLVPPNTQDQLERRLLNVVEEMAIAAGISVPSVYIMDDEPMINAFAAGYSANQAVIGVTRGCIEYLDRDELQGVIAHEFSHILNGDMRLNIRLIGVLFGLNMLVLFGWTILRIFAYSNRRSSSDNDKGGGAIIAVMALALGMLIIGFIGRLFSMLIQAAICREREFLADASAVQFTRNPAGISGALKKIGSPRLGSAVRNAESIEASHLFIGPISGLSGMSNWNPLATHPPLPLRIKRIDPSFDGVFPREVKRNQIAADFWNRKRPQKATPGQSGLGGGTPAGDTIARIGRLDLNQLLVAASLLNSIPEPAREAAHDSYGARAVIYALLLDAKPEIQQKQWGALQGREDQQCLQETRRQVGILAQVASESRIPLVQQAFPALRQLSKDQYGRFRENVRQLILADSRIDIFEYSLQALLVQDLDIHFGIAKPQSVVYYSIHAIKDQFETVLSFLAYNGTDDLGEANKAFAAGMEIGKTGGSIRSKEECTLKTFDEAVRGLNGASMPIKRKLLEAFMACVAADNQIVPREGELMRAICAVFGCPMPPMLQPQ